MKRADSVGGEPSLLLLAASSSRLYWMPRGSYRHIPILTGHVRLGAELEELTELRSNVTLFIHPKFLSAYLVPDSEIRQRLTECGITGLRPYPSLGEDSPNTKSAVRYAGNLVDPTWMSINIGGYCESSCSFCYTEFIRHEPGLATRQIIAAIDQAASIESIRAIVFTGGEPTLRKNLPELVEYARSLKFHHIGVQTNGHRMSNREYLAKLAGSGMTSVLLSIHGSTPSTHDEITKVHGSFDMACKALLLAEASRLKVTVNYVVCQDNIRDCERFAELVGSLTAAARIRFSFLIIEGAAWQRLEAVPVSYDAFAEAVRGVVRSHPDLAGRIEVANVPACVSSQLRLPPTYALHQRRELIQVSPFAHAGVPRGEQAVKLEPCADCDFANDCDGVQIPLLLRFPMLSVTAIQNGSR